VKFTNWMNYGAAVLAALPLFTAGLRGEVLVLENGDRLTGQIERLQDNKLEVTTEYAGKIAIRWSAVKDFKTDRELQLALKNGDTVNGVLVLTDGKEISVQTPKEAVSYSLDRVAAIHPLPKSPEGGVFQNWHGGLKMGLSLSRGNTDLSTLSVGADPTWQKKRDRLTTRFLVLRNMEKEQSLGNLYRISGRFDKFFSGETFFFLIGSFEKDDKARLDFRTRQGGGFGYEFRPARDTELSLFGGLTLSQERFEAARRQDEVEGLAGFELTSKLLAPIDFSTRTSWSPTISQARYFIYWRMNFSMPLWGGLNFGLEVSDDFDSSPPPGNRNNDFRLMTVLGWTF